MQKLTGYPSIDKPWEKYYSSKRLSLFENTTPYQGLVMNNEKYPNEIAIRYFGAKITFGQLINKINDISKSLKAMGINRGEYVTICSTTSPEVIYIFYALSKIGAVANIMSPFFTPQELMSRINECHSNLLFIVDKFYQKYKSEINLDTKKRVVVLPMMASSPLKYITKRYRADTRLNEISWMSFVRSGCNLPEIETDPYEPLKPQAMVYSSGTTGASKGIVLSVDSFQKLINAYGNSGFDTTRRQSVFQNIPPWHSTGLSLGINFPLSFGVTVCTDPRFDHNVFVRNILKYKPEYILSNTSMYQGFTFEENLKLLRGKTLGFLKYPVEGGEPLTEKDIQRIEAVFHSHGSKARLLNGYGECECGATITTDLAGYKFANEASGIPLPDITTIGIFTDDFHEVTYGERGNILVKTEIGMIEYYNNPEATADFYFVDENGDRWSKTGDIGYINNDGSLVVLGRKSDFTIINGKKVYNFDIERAVLQSDYVKLCEVQTKPNDSEHLVIHLVWENELASELKQNEALRRKYLFELKSLVEQELKNIDTLSVSFRIWDFFPSAHSGKRDIKTIKETVDGLIAI